MRNSVITRNGTHVVVVNDDHVDRRLSAALRAQASGLGTGSPISPRRHLARHRTGLPAWAVLALAVLLGAMAGGLAGVVSVW